MSSSASANARVRAGAPAHASAGGSFAPSHVCSRGIVPLGAIVGDHTSKGAKLEHALARSTHTRRRKTGSDAWSTTPAVSSAARPASIAPSCSSISFSQSAARRDAAG